MTELVILKEILFFNLLCNNHATIDAIRYGQLYRYKYKIKNIQLQLSRTSSVDRYITEILIIVVCNSNKRKTAHHSVILLAQYN